MKFIPNKNLEKEIQKRLEKGLKIASEFIAGDIDRFVPFATGATARSAFNGRRVKTALDKPDELFLIWNTPYAAKIFYGENMNFSTDKHIEARAYWTFTMTHKKANDFMKYAMERII